MTRTIFVALLLAFKISVAQEYFEGEIVYRSEYEKKDSSFDLNNIMSYPSKFSIFNFKNGNWIQRLDSGMIEYQYFNHDLNRAYFKYRDIDSLYYIEYDKPMLGKDSILSLTLIYNTDTVLEKVCHRLVLKTHNIKLTFIYSPTVNINPQWFSKTKSAYYDVIYDRMKSLYLGFILETDKYISRVIAVKITPQRLPDAIFPDLNKVPFVELN